jgi:tRNA(adenine34) deaminase
MSMEHTKYMGKALAQAQKSMSLDEVPVGAVIVDETGIIIARAHNRTEQQATQAAHAEVLAITKAGKKRGDWRLNGCTIYVTLEPCSMCYHLIKLSRISVIVYGAKSPLFGYSRHLDNPETDSLYKDRRLSQTVIEGVCASQATALLREFFKKKRK